MYLPRLTRKTLGTIIMNLQQTPHDRLARIRIWAKLDDTFRILASKLGLGEIRAQPVQVPEGDIYTIPYNTQGKLDKSCALTWDLREVCSWMLLFWYNKGAPIWICEPEASNFGVPGKILGRRPDGHYKVLLNEEGGQIVRLLGSWWVDIAINGKLKQLPLVNTEEHLLSL